MLATEQTSFLMLMFVVAFSLDQMFKAIFLLSGASSNVVGIFQLMIYFSLALVVIAYKLIYGGPPANPKKNSDSEDRERLIK